MDLEFQESSVVCIVPIHAFYLPSISAYEQRPPKIPNSQWYFLLEKLLSVGFNTQGAWPKDFFASFISLERMLMISCQFSLCFFLLNYLTNWCLNKAGLLLILFLCILLNLGKCVIQEQCAVSPALLNIFLPSALWFFTLLLLPGSNDQANREGSSDLSGFSSIQQISSCW